MPIKPHSICGQSINGSTTLECFYGQLSIHSVSGSIKINDCRVLITLATDQISQMASLKNDSATIFAATAPNSVM